jgi:hypothetical protein
MDEELLTLELDSGFCLYKQITDKSNLFPYNNKTPQETMLSFHRVKRHACAL